MNYFIKLIKCENGWLLKHVWMDWMFTSFFRFCFLPDFVFRVQHDVKFSHLQKTFFVAQFYSAVSWLSGSLLSCVISCVCVSVALVAEECVRQLQMRVHSNRVSAASTSSQQDLDRSLKNKREVGHGYFFFFGYIQPDSSL